MENTKNKSKDPITIVEVGIFVDVPSAHHMYRLLPNYWSEGTKPRNKAFRSIGGVNLRCLFRDFQTIRSFIDCTNDWLRYYAKRDQIDTPEGIESYTIIDTSTDIDPEPYIAFLREYFVGCRVIMISKTHTDTSADFHIHKTKDKKKLSRRIREILEYGDKYYGTEKVLRCCVDDDSRFNPESDAF